MFNLHDNNFKKRIELDIKKGLQLKMYLWHLFDSIPGQD